MNGPCFFKLRGLWHMNSVYLQEPEPVENIRISCNDVQVHHDSQVCRKYCFIIYLKQRTSFVCIVYSPVVVKCCKGVKKV